MDKTERTVAGLDVHKDSVFLCIMDVSGIKFESKFGTLTSEIRLMGAKMSEYGVSEVCMESTSVYWIPIWNELCADFELKLVNPYFIKQVPGRKSDVKDAQWIAECLYKRMVKGSYVPEPAIQQMRKYNRRIFDLNEELVYKRTKLDAALQRCGMRLSNYVSDIGGRSYRKVLDAIVSGITDPRELAQRVHGRTVGKHGFETIAGALTASFTPVDIDCFRQYLQEIDLAKSHLDHCQTELIRLCKESFPRQFEQIMTIPGVKERTATSIIAEVGTDMSHFDSAGDLVGWAGLKPRNDESNRKIKSRRITHGNKYIRKTLVEASWPATRTKNVNFFSHFSYVQTQVRKKNKMKVIVAIARKILVAVWHMFRKDENFIDFYLTRVKAHRQKNESLATA